MVHQHKMSLFQGHFLFCFFLFLQVGLTYFSFYGLSPLSFHQVHDLNVCSAVAENVNSENCGNGGNSEGHEDC